MRKPLQRICVFCGSSSGNRPEFSAGAAELGRSLGRRGIGLVYGGSAIGLMGETARNALASGADVHGVIPEAINRRVQPLPEITLEVVPDMHSRKMRMYTLADAFIALPGGIGTLEELMEVFTWLQLGYHEKPVGLLNILSFYDPLFSMLDGMVESAFLKPEHRRGLIASGSVEELLDSLTEAQPRYLPKWNQDQTRDS